MTTAFSHLHASVLPDWSYYCVGGLGDGPEDIEYFERVQRQDAGGRAFVLANVDRPELKTLFERSKIFWHAAGYEEDEDLHPQLSEHFGIVTAEAMAAGCVPVVCNHGGQGGHRGARENRAFFLEYSGRTPALYGSARRRRGAAAGDVGPLPVTGTEVQQGRLRQSLLHDDRHPHTVTLETKMVDPLDLGEADPYARQASISELSQAARLVMRQCRSV